MASVSEWIEGARLRTLPAAIAPVFAGCAPAILNHHFNPVRALLCLVVALSLQVGVNYANDYSDGIRGTDAQRTGPMRLVGSGAASPTQVKYAAFACFGLACLAGLGLVVVTGQWWLIGLGVVCVVAAWFYTGGSHPYGYHGLGEVFVFIFFGLVAVVGTCYVQTATMPALSWLIAVCAGLLSSAILVTNNLRDLDSDLLAGKRTLETRLGDSGSRILYHGLALGATVCILWAAIGWNLWLGCGLATVIFLVPGMAQIARGAQGMALVTTLKRTSLGLLAAGVGLFVGALIAVV